VRRLAPVLLVACSRADGAPVVTAAEPFAVAVDPDCFDAVPTDGAFLGVTVLDAGGAPLGDDDVDVRFCQAGVCAAPACVEGNVFHLGGLPTGTGELEVAPTGRGIDRLSTVSATVAVGVGRSTAVAVRVLPAGAPAPGAISLER
jgi:hypothetical protein